MLHMLYALAKARWHRQRARNRYQTETASCSVMLVVTIMLVTGKIRDPVDDRAGTAHELIFPPLVDRLIVESSRVQERLDLGGQRVALGVMSAMVARNLL